VAAVALITLAGCSGPASPATVGRSGGAVPAERAGPPGDGTPGALLSPAGVVVPIVGPAQGGGWTVRTPCDRTAMLPEGTPVARPAIVLDPGHGGGEPGAVGPGGATEAELNLAVARRAQDALQAAGVPALLTRTGDYTLALATRAEIARSTSPRAFVSVHHNADPDGPSSGPGSETYYQIGSPASKRLAGLIYEEVTAALARYRVAWVADRDAGAKYRPGRQGDYYAVLRLPGTVVSALAELAFLTNPPEAELLARPDVRQVEGDALARGILRWLRTSDPGSGFTEPYPRIDPPPSPGASPPACRDPQL
jgi:N-acetylmuramoyl-L-alanine amidase